MKFDRVFRGYDPKQVDSYIEETAQKESQLRAAQKQRLDELADENYLLRRQVEQYRTDEKAISKALVDSQKLASELQNNAEKFSDLTLSRAKIFYATWQAYAQTLVATLSDEEVRSFNRLKDKIEQIIDAYDGNSVRRYANDVAAKLHEKETEQSQSAFTVAQQAPLSNRPQEDFARQGVRTTAQQTPAVSVAEQSVALKQPDASTENLSAQAERAQQAPVSAVTEARAADTHTDDGAETKFSMPSEKTMGIFANPVTKVEQAAHVIDLRELIKPTESLEDLCRDLGLKNDE